MIGPWFLLGLIAVILNEAPVFIHGKRKRQSTNKLREEERVVQFVNHLSRMIWYADDLLLIARRDKIDSIVNALSASLATISLSFNHSKTEIIGDDGYTKYLKQMINIRGISRNIQITHIYKSFIKMKNPGFSGVFKNGVKEEHLLKAIGSNSLSTIEYGLAILKPTKSAAKRVDSFICGLIK